MRDVEKIIQGITTAYPTVKVTQLQVSHAGMDDDGLWFFQQPGGTSEVQIESSDGMCPFSIETAESDDRFKSDSIEETIEIVAKLLHPGKAGQPESQSE